MLGFSYFIKYNTLQKFSSLKISIIHTEKYIRKASYESWTNVYLPCKIRLKVVWTNKSEMSFK